MIHTINRNCNFIKRLNETIEIAHRNEYEIVGIETSVLERIKTMIDIHEDMLVTDIERIKRAKDVLQNDNSTRRDKNEALNLISIYQEIATYHKESKDQDERERAEEILYELYH